MENQGGGGSSLGAATVAHSSPDGYTLLLGGSSTHVTEAILKTRPLYDPIKDLEPISNIAVSPFALAVHPSIPATTLAKFIDYDKANRGKLSYGHAGVGSLNHLTGELFKSLAGLPDLLQVPYRGSGPAIADALAGHVSMVTPAMTGQMFEFHRTGRLRILAVTSPQPSDGRERLADCRGGAAGNGLAAAHQLICSRRHGESDHRADRRSQTTRCSPAPITKRCW